MKNSTALDMREEKKDQEGGLESFWKCRRSHTHYFPSLSACSHSQKFKVKTVENEKKENVKCVTGFIHTFPLYLKITLQGNNLSKSTSKQQCWITNLNVSETEHFALSS